MTLDVSVIAPVLDERRTLDELVARVSATLVDGPWSWELILVDDGSRDGSRERIVELGEVGDPRVRGLLLERNAGQQQAVRCGIEEARGRAIVTLDSDLQNPPEMLPRLLAALDAGHDLVGSVRIDRRDGPWRRACSSALNRVIGRATGVRLSDYGCMLRAYDATLARRVFTLGSTDVFLPVVAATLARRATEVPVEHAPRRHGRSRYGLAQMVRAGPRLLRSLAPQTWPGVHAPPPPYFRVAPAAARSVATLAPDATTTPS